VSKDENLNKAHIVTVRNLLRLNSLDILSGVSHGAV
jgi:hypothetical protein